MCFRRLLCVRIEIDQLQCVNCWVIIHCLSVSCKMINHSRCALVIWSSLQLTSKQWIITQQFTAGADLFLKYWYEICDVLVPIIHALWRIGTNSSQYEICEMWNLRFNKAPYLHISFRTIWHVCVYLPNTSWPQWQRQNFQIVPMFIKQCYDSKIYALNIKTRFKFPHSILSH